MSAITNHSVQAGSINLHTKMTYGCGQAVDAIIQASVNTFLLFYLTSVCGFSGSAAGSIFLVSLVVDALLDPLIGRASDNWKSRWGRRLPFMTGAILPMTIAAYLMFNLPAGLSGTPLYIYVLGLNIILRVGLSVFALPHSALTAELTDNYTERTSISTFRALFIVIGTAATLLPAFSWIFSRPDLLETRGAYSVFGMLIAILIGAFGLTCILGIFRRVVSLPIPTESGHDNISRFFLELLQLFRNPSFPPMFFGAVVVLIGQGVAYALNLHAFRYFWALPPAWIQLPLLMLPFGMLLGTAIGGLMMKRIEKRDGVIGAVLLLGAYQALSPLLIISGLVGPGTLASIVMAATSGLLFGACGALCFICFYSMIADAVDEHDLLFGIRREALYAAALMIGAKSASGVGAFLAGFGLQAVGFPTQAADSDIVLLPEGVAENIGLLWGPGAAAIILVSVPLLLRYRITKTHHEGILASLANRDTAASLAPGKYAVLPTVVCRTTSIPE